MFLPIYPECSEVAPLTTAWTWCCCCSRLYWMQLEQDKLHDFPSLPLACKLEPPVSPKRLHSLKWYKQISHSPFPWAYHITQTLSSYGTGHPCPLYLMSFLFSWRHWMWRLLLNPLRYCPNEKAGISSNGRCSCTCCWTPVVHCACVREITCRSVCPSFFGGSPVGVKEECQRQYEGTVWESLGY